MARPKDPFISFPPGTLDRESVRIPVVRDAGPWFVLDKPAAVACYPDPWIPRPTDLVREVRRQIREGKGQLKDLGIGAIDRINHLDFEASGLVLCARDEAEGARLANCLGSAQIEFTYTLVVRGAPHSPELVCRLPLAPDPVEPRMSGSQEFGKKCETRFKLLEQFRGYATVEAVTRYDRVHQVRVHANESGLKIPGERKYFHVDPVFLSEIKTDYRPGKHDREEPLYDRLCMHLGKITFPGVDGSTVTIEREPPPRFRVLIERLQRHASTAV
jgi:23S rRNA pseudouridine1911/1915/1917 synthase